MAWSEWKKFGEELKTQTVTQNIQFTGSGTKVYTITFDELDTIVGIVDLTTNDSGILHYTDATRKPIINGNTITGTIRELDNVTETITLSITCVGH